MKTSVEYITPDQALKYLGDNASFQRGVRRTVVKAYSLAMRRGEWRLTHQGIAVDVNGKLIDGQHRLLAIVDSGITVPMSVTLDVPATSFQVLDIGAKRDMADLLHIPRRHASIVNRLGQNFLGTKALSSQQALEVYDLLEPEIEKVMSVSGQNRGVFTSAPVQTAVVLNIWDKPENQKRSLELFKNMVGFNFEHLPPVAVSLASQAARGVVGASSEQQRKDVLFRTLYTLDPSKADIARVAMTPDFITGRIEYFRDKLRTALNWH